MRSAVSSDGTVGNTYDGVIDPGNILGNSFSVSHRRSAFADFPVSRCLSRHNIITHV
jgi:hypothetical protein